MCGYWRGHGDRRLVLRYWHGYLAGMQVKDGTAGSRCAPVDIVSYDGPTHLRTMDAQLMCAAGQRLKREPCEPGPTAHHLPCAGRRPAVLVDLHPPAPRVVAFRKGNVDSPVVGARSSLDHGPIAFAHLALLEQPAKQRQCLAMPTKHQATGGVAVEPVRQCRRARQPETQSVEEVFEGLAALRPALHRQARRLVDDQHHSIAIEQAGEHLFRCHAETAITGTP